MCNGVNTCKVSPAVFQLNPCMYLKPYVNFKFICLDFQGRSYTGGHQDPFEHLQLGNIPITDLLINNPTNFP